MFGKRFACFMLLLGMPAQFTNAQAYDPAQPRDDSQVRPAPIDDRWAQNEASSQLGVAEYSRSSEPVRPTTQVGPKPTVTRQRAFAIPFTLSSTQDRDQPSEVRLFVSGDQGANWSLYQRQPPTVDRFHFRAARDAEFWFVVRTVGSPEETVSVRDQQPELIVIVDTAQPAIQLAAVPGEYGGVRVDWKAADPNLAAHSFRLQYRTGPDETWQNVEVDVPDPEDWRQEFTGTADWWLKSNQANVQIRAEVLDRAGNSSVAEKTVAMPLVASAPPTGQENLSAIETYDLNQQHQDDGAPPSQVGQSSRDWWRRGPRRDEVAGEPNRTPSSSPFQPASDSRRQMPGLDPDIAKPQLPESEGFATTGEGRTYNSVVDAPPIATAPIQDDPIAPVRSEIAPVRSEIAPVRSEIAPVRSEIAPVRSEIAPVRSEIAPVRSEIAPPVANRYQPEPVWSGLDQAPRMTTSPRFQLDYDLVDVGPGGATRVELWYTTDQGRTWQLYGHDPDHQSPIDVQLQSEGLHGLRMVVYGDSAPAPRPPQDGDAADVWVGVDWTKPVARITSARHIGSERRTLLEIQWQASDAWLGDRPITLSFSEQPGGPWSTIESGLPNSGRYEWQIDRRPASHLYLRLEVRDQAGNVTTHELNQPVVDDSRRPRGRIRDLRPINEVTVRPTR